MLNRRKFLVNLGLGGFASALPGLAIPDQELISKAGLSNLTLKGRVHSNGRGIEGVVVTDGFQVSVTDRNGQYRFVSGSEAEFVYISIPAGFEIPNSEGVARYYRKIDKKAENFTVDFELTRLSGDDTRHLFVVWADTQIISKKDAELLKTQSAPDLRELVNSYPAGSFFHGFGCGDLVWDKFELFGDYKEALESTGVPFFNVIGNHDMDLDARTDEYSSRTFKELFGPAYYSFNRGKIHYVVLDDVFFIGTAKKYIGYITENQLRWLEKDLALVKPGTTVVVCLHIPDNTGVAQRYKRPDELGGTVSNREKLYKILAPYKAYIMSGHTHMNENLEQGNIISHVHGTVCGAWWTGPVCSDGTPSGYGVYEVDGDELRWYYKSTGLDRDHQFRLYDRGNDPEHPGHIIANVWNHDPAWKVEWLEDGVSRGEMEQRTNLDPQARKLYEGAELPVKHKWVEPSLTNHLFYAYPTPGAKQVTVKVTDRFGRVYEEELVMRELIKN